METDRTLEASHSAALILYPLPDQVGIGWGVMGAKWHMKEALDVRFAKKNTGLSTFWIEKVFGVLSSDI